MKNKLTNFLFKESKNRLLPDWLSYHQPLIVDKAPCNQDPKYFTFFQKRDSMARLFGKVLYHGRVDNSTTKNVDQNLLSQYLWPMAKYDMVNHDSYNCKKYQGES